MILIANIIDPAFTADDPNFYSPRFNEVERGEYWFHLLRLSVWEDLLRCWKMNGRSKVLLENQLYWRQSTGLDGNYRSRKLTARRWLHKYVRAECGASSFTWYLYQMCNTDVHLSVCGQNRVRSVSSTILIGSILYLHILSSNFRMFVSKLKNSKFWRIL